MSENVLLHLRLSSCWLKDGEGGKIKPQSRSTKQAARLLVYLGNNWSKSRQMNTHQQN